MKLTDIISNLKANELIEKHKTHICNGNPFFVPLSEWLEIPNSTKFWLRNHVLNPVEDFATSKIKEHPFLGKINLKNNNYAVSHICLIMLWNYLIKAEPKRIVEFGSGTTTRLFLEYAKYMSSKHIYVNILSVEHSLYWLNTTLTNLTEDYDNYIQIVYAPLREQYLLEKQIVSYYIPTGILQRGAGINGFDLCFIDGPPGRVGRMGCLPLIADNLNENSTIMLDDTNRIGEQTILNEWQKYYQDKLDKCCIMLLDLHGVAILNWKNLDS